MPYYPHMSPGRANNGAHGTQVFPNVTEPSGLACRELWKPCVPTPLLPSLSSHQKVLGQVTDGSAWGHTWLANIFTEVNAVLM